MITKNQYYYGHQSEERINITARKCNKSDKITIKIGKERKIYTGQNRREKCLNGEFKRQKNLMIGEYLKKGTGFSSREVQTKFIEMQSQNRQDTTKQQMSIMLRQK